MVEGIKPIDPQDASIPFQKPGDSQPYGILAYGSPKLQLLA